MCGSSAGSIPTPVSATSIRAPSGVGDDVDRHRAATRGELDGVGHQVGDDLSDPLRVVPDPDRDARIAEGDVDAPAAGGAARLFDRRFDGGAQVIRPEVEQDEPRIELRQLEQVLGEPVETLDLLGARLEEFVACLRVVTGAFAQQLVERPEGRQRRAELVRHIGQEVAAPVAIATDDLDALLEPVGHGVELDGQLGHLGRARADLALRDAPGEVALGQAARRLGQPAQRGREPAGHRRRDQHAEEQREERHRGEEAGDVGQRGRPEGVRVGERDPRPRTA